jgi:hypothetical protein
MLSVIMTTGEESIPAVDSLSSGPRASVDKRRMLRRSFSGILDAFDILLRSAISPRYLQIVCGAAIVREAMTVLLQSQGKSFSSDEEASLFCENRLHGQGDLTKEDLSLCFDLPRLAKRDRAHFQETNEDDPSIDWPMAAQRVGRFLLAADRFIRASTITVEERRRSRQGWMLILGSLFFMLCFATVFYLKKTWPLRSEVPSHLIKKPGGIVGAYYNGSNFNQKVFERVDATINLVTEGIPAPRVNADRFSVRWQGYLNIPQDGESQLCIENDDGARLFLNGKLLIDDWIVHAKQTSCALIRAKAGWYPLKVDFFDERSGARMRLLWGKNRGNTVLVPASRLCCGK